MKDSVADYDPNNANKVHTKAVNELDGIKQQAEQRQDLELGLTLQDTHVLHSFVDEQLMYVCKCHQSQCFSLNVPLLY